MAALLYLTLHEGVNSNLFPSVLSREYRTWLLIPHLTSLLRYTEPKTIAKSFAFVERIMGPISEGSFVFAAYSEWEVNHFHRFIRSFVDQLVRMSDKETRLRGQNLLFKLLALFDAEGRYHILSKLQRDCPYTNVSAHLVLTWKREFLKALEDSQVTSPFLQPRLLEIFMMTLTGNPNDLLNRLELVLTSFNFLHVVFIKCKLKPTNIDIWSAPTLNRIQERILIPWSKLVALHLDKEHAEVHSREQQQKTVEDIKKRGLPTLSATEIERAQWKNINDLTMIKQVLDRIDEVVNHGRL